MTAIGDSQMVLGGLILLSTLVFVVHSVSELSRLSSLGHGSFKMFPLLAHHSMIS